MCLVLEEVCLQFNQYCFLSVFSWYFNDEPIEAGRAGWEDAEVHDSRKMSTLILTYAREHHMGKYTVVAQNRFN